MKVSVLPVTTLCRQYQDMKQRYKDLHISSDFTKAVHSWTQQNCFSHTLVMQNPPKFNLDPEFAMPVQKHLPATLDAEGVKHNAKVLLLTMDPDAAQHPVFRFKFLVFKVEKGLISPGASWNAMDGDDPYNDVVLQSTAIRTVKAMCGIDLSVCTQWVKFVEIWYHRPTEGENKPEMKERVVLFMPDCWNHPGLCLDVYYQLRGFEKKEEVNSPTISEDKACVPEGLGGPPIDAPPKDGAKRMETVLSSEAEPKAHEELQAEKQEEGEEEKEAPVPPLPDDKDPDAERKQKAEQDLEAKKRREEFERQRRRNTVVRPMVISLDGLLDYDADDVYEKTVEVSLFAEAFHEMLQRDFGRTILDFLQEKRRWDKREKELRRAKRKAEAEAEERKRQKQEADSKPKEEGPSEDSGMNEDKPEGGTEQEEEKEVEEAVKAKEAEGVDAEVGEPLPSESVQPEPKAVETAEQEEQDAQDKLRAEARKAFQFFDKADCGYLRASDVEKILYNLDMELPRRLVHDLVSSQAERDRVDYVALLKRP